MTVAPLTRLQIGDVHFAFNSDGPVCLEAHNACYQSFLTQAPNPPDPCPVDLQIKIKAGGMPSTKSLNACFRSHEAWSIYTTDSHYYISYRPPAFENPLWIAKVNRNFSTATVYCHEKLATHRNGRLILSNPVAYPLDQILMMYILSRKQGILLHASGIEIKGGAYVFPGRSGAGKSTLARLFTEKGVGVLFSDDRIAVRKRKNVFYAFGTPWPGEAGIAVNRHAPLKGICFIYKGPANRIQKIPPKEAVTRLFPVTTIPWYDRNVLPDLFDTCEDLITQVPTYDLYFTKGPEVVDVFEKFVSG